MSDFFENPKFNKIFFQEKTFEADYIRSSIDDLTVYLKNNQNSNSPFIYLFAHNHIKTIISYFAVIKAGFIVVLVDPELKPLELNEMMTDTPPSVLIKLNKDQINFDYQNEIIFNKKYDNLNIQSDLSDVVTMLYTNAEDGYAKAVMLTKKNLLSNAQAIIDCDKISETSVCCALLPFHHMFGLQTGILGPILKGSSILIENISNFRLIKYIVTDIEKYEVSNLYTLPVIYYLLSKISEIESSLKTVISFISGGIKLPLKTFQSFFNKTGKELREGYGITEASPISSWHRPEDKIQIDSIGKPFTCCEIKIIDEEICIKGDNVMKGYYNNETATNKVIKNGWLHTGDLGKIDEDGYVYFTGLKKRMLNVGGRNVYPAEVERYLKINENVDSVEVYGQPSNLQGHVVRAKIKLKNNTLEAQKVFRKWCIANISNYKIPKMKFI